MKGAVLLQHTVEGGKITFILEYNPTALNINYYLQHMYQIVDSKEEYREVVIGLDQVEYIDSTGVTFLIGLYRYLQKNDKSMRVINARKEIVELFEIVNLKDLFHVNQ